MSSLRNGISIGSAVCAQLSHEPYTRTTLRETFVAKGRIYALRVDDAA